MTLNHIKPHGALHGMAARSEGIANARRRCSELAGTKHETVYKKRGFKFIGEFYVDLDYDRKGRLIITREHAAWDPDAAAKRTVRAMAEKKVRTIDGNDIPMIADCVCLHFGHAGAVAVAKAVREAIAPYPN